MSRFLLACLFIGTTSFAAAAEPKTQPAGTEYHVKIRFETCRDGRTRALDTVVTGVRGKPLHCVLGGLEEVSEPSGAVEKLSVTLDCHDIPDTHPTEYLAHIIVHELKDGKEVVLAAPKIVTLVDQTAHCTVGDDKNWTKIELLFTEEAKASPQVSKVSTKDASARPIAKPSDKAASSLGVMVTPRIIIVEEEEDKLGVQTTP